MPYTNEKPENCTCGFPNSGVRSMSGHEQDCPCDIEYWTYRLELARRETDRLLNLSKKLRYGHSDNVE